MWKTLFGGVIGGALVSACGGSAPPPPNAPETPAASAATAATPAPSTPTSGGGQDYDQGVAALGRGDVDGAKALQAKMQARDPKDASAAVLLGLIDEKQGDAPGAEKAYRDAIKLRPDLDAAYLNLSALLIDEKRSDDALTVARAGLAKMPSSSGLHANVASVLAEKGDQAGASSEFDRATHGAPNDPMLLVTYAHWLRVWKQGDAALAKLRAARPLAKDPGMLAAIGEEMKGLGAFSDCIGALDQAIAAKNAPELLTYRAMCKRGAKDAAGARADLDAAIAAQYAPAHFYLARVLAESGDAKGAVAEYETFLKLEPNVPAAKLAREELKRVKEHQKK